MARVVAALAVVKDASGKDVYLYQGAVVPASIPAAEVDRLVEGGFVTRADEAVTAETDESAGRRARTAR